MSLLTMKIFINALEASEDVTALVDDRIFPIAFTGSDDEFLNLPTPYIIVGYTGPNNSPETKDSVWEGVKDNEHVHVLFVGSDIDQLADIEQRGRQAIIDYFSSLQPTDENYGILPDNGLTVQGDLVDCDPYKPSFYHQLTYQCETNAGCNEQEESPTAEALT